MKIGGVEVTRSEEVLVLPRKNGEDLVFQAQAVLDMEPFEAMCPKPTATMRMTKNGQEPHQGPDYLKQITRWGENRYAYVLLQSLKPSDIEWATVDLAKPETWKNWMTDFKEAGLADTEVNLIQKLVLEANALNEGKLKAARDAFLHGQGTTR